MRKPLIIRHNLTHQTAWVVRGQIKADLYMDCYRVPLSEHDGNSVKALTAAMELATPLAEAPCNRGVEIVICEVGT